MGWLWRYAPQAAWAPPSVGRVRWYVPRLLLCSRQRLGYLALRLDDLTKISTYSFDPAQLAVHAFVQSAHLRSKSLTDGSEAAFEPFQAT
jgi:hypothetical protein